MVIHEHPIENTDFEDVSNDIESNENADDTETTIENLNIFIYGANGVFEKEHQIAFADLTDAGDNKYKTKELVATTGAKTIYVGANMTAAMIQTMKATPRQRTFRKRSRRGCC